MIEQPEQQLAQKRFLRDYGAARQLILAGNYQAGIAAMHVLVEAYHFPFPACGHMVKGGRGYELVPTMWQPL